MSVNGEILMILLTVAWLLPLVGFVVEIYWLRWSHRLSKGAAMCAVGCIATGFICSFSALLYWGTATGWAALSDHHANVAHHDVSHADGDPHHGHAAADAEVAGEANAGVAAEANTESIVAKKYF
jgi:NADH-quinone oxidoreductase subunit L